MKICPKCNEVNKNNNVRCKNCSENLSNVKFGPQELIEKNNIKKEKRNDFKRLINIILMLIVPIISIISFVITGWNSDKLFAVIMAIVFYIMAYVILYYPKVLFYLKNIFVINNFDEVELSSFYYITTKITGYMFLLMGLIFIILSWYI